MKWGIYQMSLVLITETPGPIYGPGALVHINIEVDGVWQVDTFVWSATNSLQQSVWTEIVIDFHLNVGQFAQQTWERQIWLGTDHTIDIINMDPVNTLYLDEFHLSTV